MSQKTKLPIALLVVLGVLTLAFGLLLGYLIRGGGSASPKSQIEQLTKDNQQIKDHLLTIAKDLEAKADAAGTGGNAGAQPPADGRGGPDMSNPSALVDMDGTIDEIKSGQKWSPNGDFVFEPLGFSRSTDAKEVEIGLEYRFENMKVSPQLMIMPSKAVVGGSTEYTEFLPRYEDKYLPKFCKPGEKSGDISMKLSLPLSEKGKPVDIYFAAFTPDGTYIQLVHRLAFD